MIGIDFTSDSVLWQASGHDLIRVPVQPWVSGLSAVCASHGASTDRGSFKFLLFLPHTPTARSAICDQRQSFVSPPSVRTLVFFFKKNLSSRHCLCALDIIQTTSFLHVSPQPALPCSTALLCLPDCEPEGTVYLLLGRGGGGGGGAKDDAGNFALSLRL